MFMFLFSIWGQKIQLSYNFSNLRSISLSKGGNIKYSSEIIEKPRCPIRPHSQKKINNSNKMWSIKIYLFHKLVIGPLYMLLANHFHTIFFSYHLTYLKKNFFFQYQKFRKKINFWHAIFIFRVIFRKFDK